jgi:lysine decarboxylase
VSNETVRIISALKEQNVTVIVDEAHGTHLKFHESYPVSALDAGADLVIHSGFKTMNGPTQTALIHNNSKRIINDDLRKWLRSVHTTSPNYVLLLELLESLHNLDRAEEQLEIQKAYFEDFSASLPQLVSLANEERVLTHEDARIDYLKLPLDFSKCDVNGITVGRLLTENGIFPEMVSKDLVLLYGGLNMQKSGFNRLKAVLSELNLTAKSSPEPQIPHPAAASQMVPIRDAMQMDYEYVSLKEARYRISSDFVGFYPPGSPLLIPGDFIDDDMLDFIINHSESSHSFGIRRSEYLKVVKLGVHHG